MGLALLDWIPPPRCFIVFRYYLLCGCLELAVALMAIIKFLYAVQVALNDPQIGFLILHQSGVRESCGSKPALEKTPFGEDTRSTLVL